MQQQWDGTVDVLGTVAMPMTVISVSANIESYSVCAYVQCGSLSGSLEP